MFFRWNIPSFSYDKGELPEAEEGESVYIYINDVLYTFTIHEGECHEANWSGAIYSTDALNFREVDDEEKETLNLVEYNPYSNRRKK